MTTPPVFWSTVAVCLLLVVGATPAHSAADPLGDLAPDLLEQAETVLDTAPSDLPLEVVVTTEGAPGERPEFTTIAVDGRTDALETIATALQEPDTAGVDMVQPAVIAGRANDQLRKNQWGLDTLRWETDASPYSKGGNVEIAVIDTGVTINHPDLKGRVTTGRDFVTPGTWAADANGHGTHVAGVIAAAARNKKFITGIAPWSTIVPVRVLDSRGRGTTDDVGDGIMWAADQGVNVINLSLTAPPTTNVQRAIEWAVSRNIVVVAAGGNSACPLLGNNLTTYPAAYPGVIGVGAIDRTNATASFSSCGSWIDVMAPGVSIMSLMNRAPQLSGCTAGRYWCVLSGTSAAAPVVAAAAALRIARTGLSRYSAQQVSSQIMSTATDLGPRGRDNETGHGLVTMKPLLQPR